MQHDIGPLDDQLTRFVRRLRRGDVRELLTHGVADPLGRAQHIVLARVALREPVRQSDLAEALDVDVSTISRQVGSLCDAGLVSRSPDPSDGRASQLAITTTGRAKLEEMRRARQAAIDAALEAWTRQDVARFTELLDRFARDLDAASQQP